MKLLEDTLSAIVIEVPQEDPKPVQHLCADDGYREKARKEVIERGCIPHIRSRGEEQQEKQDGKRARRYGSGSVFLVAEPISEAVDPV